MEGLVFFFRNAALLSAQNDAFNVGAISIFFTVKVFNGENRIAEFTAFRIRNSFIMIQCC